MAKARWGGRSRHPGHARHVLGPGEQGRRVGVLPPGGGLHGQRLVGHTGLGPEAEYVQQLDGLAGQRVRLDVVAQPGQSAGGQRQAEGERAQGALAARRPDPPPADLDDGNAADHVAAGPAANARRAGPATGAADRPAATARTRAAPAPGPPEARPPPAARRRRRPLRRGRRPASPAPGRPRRPARPPEPPPASSPPGRRGGSRSRPSSTSTRSSSRPPRAHRPLRRPPTNSSRARTKVPVYSSSWPRTNSALARSASPARRRRGPPAPAGCARTPSPARWALSAAAASRGIASAGSRISRAARSYATDGGRVAAPRSLGLGGGGQLQGQLPVVAGCRLGPMPGPRRAGRQRGSEGRMRLAPLGRPARCQAADRSSGCRKVRTTPACSSTPAASSRHCPGSSPRCGERVGDRGQRLVVAGRGEQDRGPASGRQAGELLLVQVAEPSGNRQRRGQRGRAGALHRGEHPAALEQGQRVARGLDGQPVGDHRGEVPPEQPGGVAGRQSSEAAGVRSPSTAGPGAGPDRRVSRKVTRSCRNRRAANSSASVDSRSSQGRSSTTMSSGSDSAAAASRPKVAAATAKRSPDRLGLGPAHRGLQGVPLGLGERRQVLPQRRGDAEQAGMGQHGVRLHALDPDGGPAIRGGRADGGLGDRGLADAGLTLDDQHAEPALTGRGPERGDPVQHLSPADQCRVAKSVVCGNAHDRTVGLSAPCTG